jgi:hypothetical protein
MECLWSFLLRVVELRRGSNECIAHLPIVVIAVIDAQMSSTLIVLICTTSCMIGDMLSGGRSNLRRDEAHSLQYAKSIRRGGLPKSVTPEQGITSGMKH